MSPFILKATYDLTFSRYQFGFHGLAGSRFGRLPDQGQSTVRRAARRAVASSADSLLHVAIGCKLVPFLIIAMAGAILASVLDSNHHRELALVSTMTDPFCIGMVGIFSVFASDALSNEQWSLVHTVLIFGTRILIVLVLVAAFGPNISMQMLGGWASEKPTRALGHEGMGAW